MLSMARAVLLLELDKPKMRWNKLLLDWSEQFSYIVESV